jgi:outer membrane protein OmpA-like peptidoglycan-associated protein
MKNSKYLFHFLLFCLLSFSVLGQKKKGGFWDSVKEAGNAVSGRKVIEGNWGELGAGGYEQYGFGKNQHTLYSPRNHKYSFDVLNNNSEIHVVLSSTNGSRMYIISEFGENIGPSFGIYDDNKYGSKLNFPRSGKYFIYLNAPRFSRGAYRVELNGSVSNIERKAPTLLEEKDLGFGIHGSGDSRENIQSPRNHKFVFEPKTGTYYDINVSSKDGLPVDFTIIEPSGKVLKSRDISSTPGIRYLISKSTLSGEHTIYVGSTQSGSRGSYNIEILGDLIRAPQKVEYNFESIKGVFSGAGDIQEYTISLKSSTPLEVLYRSTNVNADRIYLKDPYSSTINSDWRNSPTGQYQNEFYKISSAGDHKISLQGQSSGDYELLVWGDFDNIEKTSSTVEVKNASNSEGQNGVKTEGQIQSGQTNTDYSSIKVVADDYGSGQRVAETSPDKTGKYTLDLDPGKKYSITVLSDGKYIASTENIDLTSGNISSIKPQPITLLGSSDIGKKLTLNNIFFETGSPILLRQSYAELKRAATFLKANPKMKIEIAGHTDSVGDDASNLILSQNRANAVLYYLQDQLDDFSRLSAKGYGKNEPIAPNSTEDGRKQNRRVEIKIRE